MNRELAQLLAHAREMAESDEDLAARPVWGAIVEDIEAYTSPVVQDRLFEDMLS